jgi:hypothetical protein
MEAQFRARASVYMQSGMRASSRRLNLTDPSWQCPYVCCNHRVPRFCLQLEQFKQQIMFFDCLASSNESSICQKLDSHNLLFQGLPPEVSR